MLRQTKMSRVLLATCVFMFIKGIKSFDEFESDLQRVDEDGTPVWSYVGRNDVDEWGKLFPRCNGQRQSPVDIVAQDTAFRAYPSPLEFVEYDEVPDAVEVINTGHGVTVKFDFKNDVPAVRGGGLSDTFEFFTMTLHWGQSISEGSEHTVDGVRYPLEVQLLHYNKRYGSPDEALKHADGIAAFAVFAHGSGVIDNVIFNPILDAVGSTRRSGDSEMLSNPRYSLFDILPLTRRRFFRYEGSNTVPNCDESFIWTVFADPIFISNAQLNKLRQTDDIFERKQTSTYRVSQDLNGRTVNRSFLVARNFCVIPLVCDVARSVSPFFESSIQAVAVVVRSLFNFPGVLV